MTSKTISTSDRINQIRELHALLLLQEVFLTGHDMMTSGFAWVLKYTTHIIEKIDDLHDYQLDALHQLLTTFTNDYAGRIANHVRENQLTEYEQE